ncbi:MAG: hypothetical protein U1E65_05820 [Myxococcota bacterium]
METGKLKAQGPANLDSAAAQGPSHQEMLNFLKIIASELEPRQRTDGSWWVDHLFASLPTGHGTLISTSESGKSAADAVRQAFEALTTGAPVVHLPAGTKVQWNGNGWNVLAGSLETLKARTREVLYPEADAGTKAVTGQVETKSQLPSIPVIEKYPSLKSSYETSRLLDKGFALDQAGHTEQALEEYKLAHGTLRVELHHALEAKMKERGADPDQLLTLSANADPMIVGMLARSGLFAELPPGLQEATLKYFNRNGLAMKHDGAPDMAYLFCSMAVQLKPNYGPALYNMACAALAIQPAPGQGNPVAQKAEALEHLGKAIQADKKFFTELAKKDPDWNSLRGDPEFRALLG